MKKFFNFIAVACTIAVSASCAKEILPEQTVPVKEDGLVQLTFTGSLDALTKASLTSSLTTEWEKNDSIAIIDGSGSIRLFKIDTINTKGIATFTGEAKDTTAYYAVYPYTAAVKAGNDTVKVVIPSVQNIAEKQLIDPAALVSAAFTADPKSPMAFKNVVSLAKIILPAGTQKAVLAANTPADASAPSISGTVSMKITADGAGSTECADGSSSVTLNLYDGAPAGTYYMAVAPSTLPAGMNIIIGKQGDIKKLSTDNSQVFVRNSGLNLGNVANNEKTVNIPFVINTVNDFIVFSQNTALYSAADTIKFGADLDFQGAEIVTHTDRYNGSIDGQKHRIYNYQIHSGEGAKNAADAAVFGRVGNGTTPIFIKDLAFGTKDYDFESGKGTYDGTSKVTFATVANGTTYYYPGCIAYVMAKSTCDNLVNFTPVEITSACTAPHRGAPLLGTVKANVNILNCKNFGSISDATETCSKAPTIAGISGALDGADCVVDNCVNEGDVIITGNQIQESGGLLGKAGYACKISNSVNKGNVTVDMKQAKALFIGGITGGVGSSKKDYLCELSNLKNEGNITINLAKGTAAEVQAGGIAACSYGFKMTDCDNSGNVSVAADNAGQYCCCSGILSILKGNTALTYTPFMTSCDNSGNVSLNAINGSYTFVGGVHSCGQNVVNFTDCTNSGDITYAGTPSKYSCVAGVLAYFNKSSQVKGCSNSGHVGYTGNSSSVMYIGGVAGMVSTVTTSVLEDCENTGTVDCGSAEQTTTNVYTYAGGIAGTSVGSFKNCTNKGEIKFNSSSTPNLIWLGGITSGYNSIQTVEGCKNEGNITVGQVSKDNYSVVGGLLGANQVAKSITSSSNAGNIVCSSVQDAEVTKSVYVGGLFGVAYYKAACPVTTACKVQNCSITTDASTAPYAGMVIGRNAYATAWSLASAEDPVVVSGSLNGVAVDQDNVNTLALGSGNTDSAGSNVTVYAAYGAN